MAYQDVFGGSTIQPSDVEFSAVALSSSIPTHWPPYATTGQVLSRIMKVTASVASLAITLPDATLAGTGQDVLFDNAGAETFTVLDNAGGVVATIASGAVKYLYLSDTATAAGVWRVTVFGVGSSALDAAAFAGYGLKAIGATLNTAAVATEIGGDTTVTSADRSKIFVWTGGSGALTLPTTVGSTSDFAIEVRNQGTGTLTLAPVGGVLIDDSTSVTLSVQESCFLHMGATDWYTVGRGRNTAFNFTQLIKATTGGTTVLTLTEASNVVQKYIGVLASNATITVPAVVQVYYVSNETTEAYTLTFNCAGGGTSVAVTQAQAAILFCDGVNVINANTSLDSGISSIIFGTGTVANPSVAIATPSTGFYSSGTNEIGITCNGMYVGKWAGSGLTAVGSVTAASFVGSGTSLTNTIAPQTHAATSKATPVDADEIPLVDSAASNGLKKLTWANIKATLATWIGGGTIAGSFTTLASSGNTTLGDAEATDTHAVKGTTTVLANSANPAMKVTQTGAGDAFVVEDSTSPDSTPVVIDGNGFVNIGHTASITDVFGESTLQVRRTDGNLSSFSNYANDNNAGIVYFNKARGGSITAPTVLSSGDTVSSLLFSGYDGAAFKNAAEIKVVIDGTPGTNDMPGRLVFSTTADGTASSTERMRIDSSGNVLVTNPAGLGYGTGAGGTATQPTSRTTTVPFGSAKPTGAITLFTAAGSATPATFTVTNAAVAATDTVVLSVKSGTNKYVAFVSAVAAGSFNVTFWATTGTASDAPVINFAVIKGATT